MSLYNTTTSSISTSESTHSVFGLIVHSHLNFGYTALMIALIVFFVVFVEKFFEFLKSLTNDTPFCKVIPALEGELMAIGFTAFVFKIYLNADSNFPAEYKDALEFSDILVPFFSISGCFLGLLLVVASVKLSDNWSKAYHANNFALINEFFEQYHSWRYWIPSIANSTLHRIEFKILHHVFCEMFKLKKASFAYDEYVEIVFEKFILRLIHTDPVHWLLFFALLVGEWARTNYVITITSCPISDEVHNMECVSIRSADTFIMAGAIMYGISWIFVLVSRYYELCFIRIKGIESMEFYPAYLYYIEMNHPEESRNLHDMRKDEDELKMLVSAAIERSELAKRRQSNRNFLYPDFIASYFGKDSPIAPIPSGRNSMRLRVQRHRAMKAKLSTTSEAETDSKKVEPNLTEAKVSTPIDTNRNTLFEKIETTDLDSEVLVADVESNVPEQEDNMMSVKSCYTPEQLSYYIDSQKYFGDKQKHAPLIESTSMSNVISALYVPVSKKKIVRFNSFNEEDEDENAYSYHSNADVEVDAGVVPGLQKASSSPLAESSREIEISLKPSHRAEQDTRIVHPSSEPIETNHHGSSKSDKNDHESTLHAMAVNLWNHHSTIFHRHRTATHDTNVFFLSRPYLFFESIKLLLMLIALYCALWLIQYLPAKELSAQWKVYCVIPLLMTAANFVIVVKSAVLLKAIHEIDKESMMEVIEQTEGARSLEDLIRSRIVERIADMSECDDEDEDEDGGVVEVAEQNSVQQIHPYTQSQDIEASNKTLDSKVPRNYDPEKKLAELFYQIDKDHSGLLTRSELTRFLHSLDIYFSRRKWQQIFRQMDKNQEFDKLISLTEFSMFVFPETSSALDEETNRIQKLKEEARRRTIEFAHILEKLHSRR